MNKDLVMDKLRALTDAELEAVAKDATHDFLRGAARGLLERRAYARELWGELLVDDETAAALDELERATGKNVRVA